MTKFDRLPLALKFAPMEANLVAALPEDGGWRVEPKWDGLRCLAFRSGDPVDLRAKSLIFRAAPSGPDPSRKSTFALTTAPLSPRWFTETGKSRAQGHRS